MNLVQIDYTNYQVVRKLILFRSELIFRANNQQDSFFLEYSLREFDYEFKDFVTEAYDELDMLIELCKFSDKNLYILELLSTGHDFNTVAFVMGVQNKTIFNRLKRMVMKINNVARERADYENYTD